MREITLWAYTQQQVLERLAKEHSSRRAALALTNANVLSEVAAQRRQGVFSINVDATEARAWEGVRAEAEAAVTPFTGVSQQGQSRPLTCWARVGDNRLRRYRRCPWPAATSRRIGLPQQPGSGLADVEAIGNPGHRRRHRGGIRKGRGRKIDYRASTWRSGLRDLGLRVGLLDADIYGPSVPRLTGIRDKPALDDNRKMIPIKRFGLAIMSIGFLVEEETAMIWRGPMVMSAITQMLRDVVWGTLDVLVVDMPPGTGDAQLTLAQNVPLKGAIIISTPQDLSLIDARRGLAMFKKVNVPVLGIVENMSYFQCPHCGTRSDIFAGGGARHGCRVARPVAWARFRCTCRFAPPRIRGRRSSRASRMGRMRRFTGRSPPGFATNCKARLPRLNCAGFTVRNRYPPAYATFV